MPSPSQPNQRGDRRQRLRQHQNSLLVTVEFDEQRLDVRAADLVLSNAMESIAERCRSASSQIEICFHNLLRLPNEARFTLFTIVGEQKERVDIRIPAGNESRSFNCLLDAILSLANADMAVLDLEKVRLAAIEAIAILYPDSVDIACGRVAKGLREAGVTGVLPQTLAKQVRGLVGLDELANFSAEAAAKRVLELLAQEVTDGENADDEDSEGNHCDEVLRYYTDQFYDFTGLNWKPVELTEFKAIVTRILQDIGQGDRVTARFLMDVVANLKGMTLVRCGKSPMPLWIEDARLAPSQSPYIAFRNGMVHLNEAIESEAHLYEHDSRHFSDVILPYDFEPDAQCPLWEQTLQEIFPTRTHGRGRRRRSDRRVQLLQEFMGYTLLSTNMKFHKFLVLYGDGANGKSTITTLWINMLGRENVSHVALDGLSGEFRLWQMLNKQANIVADMNRLERVEEGMLKNLVSGDPIQVNRKNLPLVTMFPTAKLIFGTNNLPPINDRTNGLWRRLLVIPFLERFDEQRQDRRRVERLCEELPGVFNWSLQGARRLLQRDNFSFCDVCSGTLADYRQRSDPVAQFIDDCMTIAPGDTEVSVPTTNAYKCFQHWCEQNGRRPMSSSEFGKQILAREGVCKIRESTSPRRYLYRGLKLSPNGCVILGHSR